MRVRLAVAAGAVLWLGAPGAAHAAGPEITPGTGARLTSDTVTVSVRAPVSGGTLSVDGARVGSGWGRTLTHTIDGHAVANGTHRAVLDAALSKRNDSESVFEMAVPAYPPSGVAVRQSGRRVTVTWHPGGEPDITGYAIGSPLFSRTVGRCGPCSAVFALPESARGELAVRVVAHRTNAEPSGPGVAAVRLKAAASRPSARPAPTQSTRSGTSTASARPGPSSPAAPPGSAPVAYPSGPLADLPEEPDPLPEIAPQAQTAIEPVAATEDLWPVGPVAALLILMLSAAHLGAWRRRRTAARAAD